MFGLGPMELMLGGLCCSGVTIAGVVTLIASINSQKRGDQNPADQSAMRNEVERLKSNDQRGGSPASQKNDD